MGFVVDRCGSEPVVPGSLRSGVANPVHLNHGDDRDNNQQGSRDGSSCPREQRGRHLPSPRGRQVEQPDPGSNGEKQRSPDKQSIAQLGMPAYKIATGDAIAQPFSSAGRQRHEYQAGQGCERRDDAQLV